MNGQTVYDITLSQALTELCALGWGDVEMTAAPVTSDDVLEETFVALRVARERGPVPQTFDYRADSVCRHTARSTTR